MSTQRFSIFKTFSPLWRALPAPIKTEWRNAGLLNGISGWQLFVSDNSARLRAALDLNMPVSQLWQVATGVITIENPASEIMLEQAHPQFYYEARKVRGSSWKLELVQINELFSLPLEIQIRYKSAFTPVGSVQVARYFARVWSSYQGRDIYRDIEINFDPNSDWKLESALLQTTYGALIGYTLYIEIIGYTGIIQFDNVRAIHSGQNWARDASCIDISKNFSGGLGLVKPFWTPTILPVGSSYFSRYGGL